MSDPIAWIVIFAAKLAGSLQDSLNWAMIVAVVGVSLLPTRWSLAFAIVAAIGFAAFHITYAWDFWMRAGVATTGTAVWVVIMKLTIALIAWGVAQLAKRIFQPRRLSTRSHT